MFATGFLSALLVSTSHAFLEVPYNKTHQFGPDGPWQAVSIGVKYSNWSTYSNINVYPSVLYDTIAALYVPSDVVCQDDTTGQCAVGGTIGDLTNVNSYSWYTYYNAQTGFYFYLNGSTAYTDVQLPNNVALTNALTDVVSAGTMTYPNGITLPVEVGYAGLGGNPLDRHMNAPLSLYLGDITQSNSYGLHIGAATLDYPGSLIFGGYDRGRVLGPVIKYDAHSPLSLIDVEIGVETGESPFDFEMQTELLDIPASTGLTNNVPILVKPEYPYIILNRETLDKIATHLPVKFDKSAGFFLWDVQDPSYTNIVNSPAYLGFVFPSVSGNTANTTIKVPFKLLNLTLESSASGFSTDVPYFPVMATQIGGDSALDAILGRAFLQAAFIGTNWGQNTSWLAQAPGPGSSKEGLGYDAIDMDNGMTTLNVQQGDNLFKRSWEGHWTVLGANSSSGGSTQPGSSGSTLSGGAIAGIVVAAIAGIAIVAATVAFLLLRKNKRRRAAEGQSFATGQSGPSNVQPYYTDKPQEHAHHPAHEPDPNTQNRGELDGQEYYKQNQNFAQSQPPQQQYYGMPIQHQQYEELPGHVPQELPANPKTT